MPTPSVNKYILVVAALLVTVAVVFYFQTGRSKSDYTTTVDPAFGEYITSYTAGVLSSGSAIRVVLAKDAVDSLQIGETSEKLFSFDPSIQGKTIWLDRHTVEFYPANRLASGQTYEVEFAVSRVMEVPDNLKEFVYSFQVIPQNFELTINNLKPYVRTELKRLRLEGSVVTADYADDKVFAQLLTAQQAGKALTVNWTHSNGGKQHSFVVEDVARTESASQVKLDLKGAALGIAQSETKSVDVPALGEFKVMQVFVEQGSSQHVVLQFSDPLREKQNLQGLISITDLASIDFEIKDNEIHVFPPVRQKGSKTITIEPGIRNVLDYRMSAGTSFEILFEQLLPSVRFVGKGNILPSTDGLILPFEAVNLKAVDVQVIKIFESNVLQFLQVNDLDGNYELRRVGRPLVKRKVSLESSGVTDLGKWNRYTLDLAQYIQAEPGALYQVLVGFKRAYSTYACTEGAEGAPEQNLSVDDWEQPDNEDSAWDSYEDYYYGEDYEWEQRDNPCNNSYYTSNRTIKRNVLASDLGILAKRGGDGKTVAVVTDLRTTKPITGVNVELFDFQQTLLGSGTTDGDGKVAIESSRSPFVLIAKNGDQRGYLRLMDGESVSLSNFDVGGSQVEHGLKGMIYGERGVWRPGDSLYLTFLLEDKLKLLPANHPVVMEMQNPQGQIVNRLVRSNAENGFYNFSTVTSPDAPTGNWTARVKVGGTEFTQPVRIEMIKPNRLKINLDFGKEKITAEDNNISGTLSVNWLHGAPGRNLKAEFEALLVKSETRFEKYPEFTFDDPAREAESETQKIFEGFTDDEGKAEVNAQLEVSGQPAGVMQAIFRGKVFEESGNFSIDKFTIPFYPYTSFTGIRLPQGDKARGMLLTDTTHRVDVVTVDANGKGVSREQIEMTLHKLEWRWWWDNAEGNANYMTGRNSTPIATGKIKTTNGKGVWTFKVKYPEWGRYIVRAFDPISGHSTAKVVYIDWPGWAGRARNESQGASMLSFSSDKPVYKTGEKAQLVIPGSGQGRALISIENGSKVLSTHWLETNAGDNPFEFEVTSQMTPNVFASVTLLQPHSQTLNDLPIRLYGVIPIMVEDPQTHLSPVIKMPDVLEPGKEVVIAVSEQTNRKMTYTLAMVDEGLLDLTRFKTPDGWPRFYAREALGVKTWDVYDAVMGAFGGKVERLLAIGGDMLAASKEDDSKTNRFKPVVKYLGPFTLNGGEQQHRFIMPAYIGSVRTMIIAGDNGAYGSAEKATPVRKPLMVLATLPRVLGPDEEVKLPVTLFTMDKNIRNVKVEVKVSGPASLAGEKSKTISMDNDNLTIDFDLSVKSETGKVKVEVNASSGAFNASDVINIEVRNPNPSATKIQEALLESGKSWSGTINPVGVAGTNLGVLELSNLPPINLGQRLRYLMQYPYGCIEQTTSSVFPQLYLDQVKVLTDDEKSFTQRNVKAGIERIKLFITRDGGFAYWPGNQDSESWASTYAGHFLLEAQARGYFVSGQILSNWKRYQRAKASEWRKHTEFQSSELIQAYRLYSLALSGDPDLGSMNRMKEMGGLSSTGAWMLAAAYAQAGQLEAAKSLVSNLSVAVKPYQEMAYSYGSDTRDKAIILETLILLNDRIKAFELVKEISASLSNQNSWMSTQAVAWCLKAVGKFAGAEKKGPLKFKYSMNGKEVTASTDLTLAQVPITFPDTKPISISIESQTQSALFVRVITEGIPSRGSEESASSNLTMSIAYTDVDGKTIDPSSLQQGQEFIAAVTVSNPGLRGVYKNLALNQTFPSGWEINNLRLDDATDRLPSDESTYLDIRDDRVYTYFDLNANERKTFRVMLTASYGGSFYMPAVSCEAMYDRSVFARSVGFGTRVVK